jgi:hypothetical protein
MCRDTVLLGNGHIDQFIEIVSLDQIQALLQLSVQSTTETIFLLDVCVSMVACILAQMIKGLCILEYRAVPLSQCQKFIELPLNESFRDMVRSEGCLKFFPIDNMSIWLHCIVIVPPNASVTTKLLGCEKSFVCFGALNRE